MTVVEKCNQLRASIITTTTKTERDKVHTKGQNDASVTYSEKYHRSIKINQPIRCNNFTNLLLDVYVWLNMFRAHLRPSLGTYNCTRSLWFYRWSVVGRGLQPTTNNAPPATLQR